MLTLAGCSAMLPATLEAGAALETPVEIRQQRAHDLDRRLIERNGGLQPVIGVRTGLPPEQRLVVSNFVELMPTTSLVLGGRANYILEIDKRRRRPQWDKERIISVWGDDDTNNVWDVTFAISLVTRSGRELVSEASQTGRCLDSEAIFTSPTRCSLLESLILQRALEKL